MAPVEWHFSAVVKGASDAVFAWLSDYQSDDHNSAAFRKGAGQTKPPKHAAKRQILSREGNTLKIHDEWGRSRFDSTVELVPLSREVKITGAHGYSAVWKAVPEGDKTKLEVHGTWAPKGFLKLFVPLLRKGFVRDMELDFKGHTAELENDLAG